MDCFALKERANHYLELAKTVAIVVERLFIVTSSISDVWSVSKTLIVPQEQRCHNQACSVAFKPQCRSHKDCVGKSSRFCSGNGKCEWQCMLHSDCSRTQQCREHLCEALPNNNFCVTDTDCVKKVKKLCSSTGNCEWDCRKDTDCPSSASCQKNKCVTVSSNCKSDKDCPRSDLSKCFVSSGQCVACLVPNDCPSGKSRCVHQKCEANTTPVDCSKGCTVGEFCANGKRCIKKPTACQNIGDCLKGENCMQLGKGVNACLPICDPTQNKSKTDRTNASCWLNFGWCYGISNDNPKDGACYPPQLNIRKWKEECGQETKLDSPSYHLCVKGLSCIDDKGSKYCWKPCDPKKNVGGKPDVEDKIGNALVYTAVKKGNASSSAGLVLTNSGKTIQLLDANKKVLDRFAYGGAGCLGNKKQSVTKSPDLTGACKLHSKASPTKALFSPGRRSNGKPF